jgi:hypothetical protein
MTIDLEGSVSGWIGGLKAGDPESIERLWARYFDRIVRLARGRLRSSHRNGLDGDEEDVALSAFDALCREAKRGQFPQLGDREGLWKLLVVLTVRKSLNKLEHDSALKRGGGRVVRETDFCASETGTGWDGLDRFAGPEPPPEFASLLADECRRVRDGLGAESLRLVFDLLLEGATREGIAARMGCTLRAVTRKVEMIRAALACGGA